MVVLSEGGAAFLMSEVPLQLRSERSRERARERERERVSERESEQGEKNGS